MTPFPQNHSALVSQMQSSPVSHPNASFPMHLILIIVVVVVVVQSLSHIWLFATPWITARQAPLSSIISQSLLKFMSTESVILSNHFLLCCPVLLLPSIFPCIRIFLSESALHIRWPRYWSFSFSNSPSNEYSGFVSFRIDLFHLLAVQGTLKSLLQHHSSKTSILLQ